MHRWSFFPLLSPGRVLFNGLSTHSSQPSLGFSPSSPLFWSLFLSSTTLVGSVGPNSLCVIQSGFHITSSEHLPAIKLTRDSSYSYGIIKVSFLAKSFLVPKEILVPFVKVMLFSSPYYVCMWVLTSYLISICPSLITFP